MSPFFYYPNNFISVSPLEVLSKNYYFNNNFYILIPMFFYYL